MPELASIHVCLGKLNLSAAISWGSDDAPEQPVFGPPDLIDTPDLDDDLGDRLGFRN
jgi:hypothetical protein